MAESENIATRWQAHFAKAALVSDSGLDSISVDGETFLIPGLRNPSRVNPQSRDPAIEETKETELEALDP